MTMDDLTPLPAWRQRVARWRQKWIRSRNRRQAAYRSFKSAAQKGLTLAISVLGAILISYGVWQMYAPLGYVVGGFLSWLLLWSAEKDRERRR